MTVTTSTARVVHNGNGTTTQFAVPFRFLENGHVAVFLRDAAGGQVQWIENTQYTLTGAGEAAGGTLTVITSPTDHTPASGETLVILRSVPITQETDYVENDPFPAETHERALDKLTMVNQEQTERLDRTFTIPETDALAGDFVLPGEVERASKFLAFDALGNPIVSIGTAAGQTVPFSAFGQSWVSAADAAAGRVLLDAPGLSVANTFTADQTINANQTNTGSFITLRSTDDTAQVGPLLIVARASPSPAANDLIGKLSFSGRNSLAAALDYADLQTQIFDPTDGSEDGELQIHTLQAGTRAVRVRIGGGLRVGSPTDGDKGTGTVNATQIWEDGKRLAEVILGSGTVSSSTASLDITDLPPGFRAFELRFDDLEISAASAALRVLTRQQGSGTFDTGASDYSGSSCGSSAGSAAFQVIAGGAFQSAITCNHAFVLTNDAPARCAGVIRLHNPRDASTYTPVTGHIFYNRTGGSNHATFGWNRAAAHDVDAFRVLLSTGNIVTMNWTLYGVRAS